MARKNQIGLVVGIIVVLALLAGLYLSVEDNPLRKPYLAFTIRFDDVTGLRDRSKVLFLGIPAGYVRGLDYDLDQSAVRVQVVINRKLKIPANVTAHLEPSLLGDATIALRPAEPEQTNGFTEPNNRQLLANGVEITGQRATKIEAVLPGFDAALTKIASFGAAAEQRITDLGSILDVAVGSMNNVFIAKDQNGKTPVEELVANLQQIINGPEGGKDPSIRVQLQSIVQNLQASSESIKHLSSLQGNEKRSIGNVLETFEQAARTLSEDAGTAQKILGRMGRASDSVTQAGEQLKILGSKATDAVDQFNSRPLHYLTTTRSLPTPTPRKSSSGS